MRDLSHKSMLSPLVIALTAMTRIAILGGGSVGSTLAQNLLNNGKDVVIAARDAEKTQAKLPALVVQPMAEALASSQVIVLAVPGQHDDKGLQELAASLGDVRDKIIIDATNPLSAFPGGLQVRWEQGTSGAEVLAQNLPNSKVYKAFNTVGVEHMRASLGKDMFFAGDPDEVSLTTVEEVIRGVGFKPFYVGPTRYARNLEAMGELWIHMAIPPLGARNTTRNFWFSIAGDP